MFQRPTAGGVLQKLLRDQLLQMLAVELVTVVEPFGLGDSVGPVDGAAEPEAFLRPLSRCRGAVGEVAARADEAVPFPPGGWSLRFLLKVQREVPHESPCVGDRSDMLATLFGVNL